MLSPGVATSQFLKVCPLPWVPRGPVARGILAGAAQRHTLRRELFVPPESCLRLGAGLALLIPGLRSLGQHHWESSFPGVSSICGREQSAEEDSHLGGRPGPAETRVGKRDNSESGSSRALGSASPLHPGDQAWPRGRGSPAPTSSPIPL